jgi:hypothetical protein
MSYKTRARYLNDDGVWVPCSVLPSRGDDGRIVLTFRDKSFKVLDITDYRVRFNIDYDE